MLTTHYMEEADKLCGRVAIMDHGKILALDTPADLKQSVGADTIVTVRPPATPTGLAELLGRRHGWGHPDPHRRRRRGAPHARHRPPGPPDRDGRRGRRALDLADLSVAEPTLETVFISLTGKELRD